jgi:hypothetical protein
MFFDEHLENSTMKFFLFLMILFSSAFLCAKEKDKSCKTAITRVFFETHSYICFDNKFYIHDPDCRCDSMWGGVIYGDDGNVKETIHLIRPSVTPYD